MRPTKLESVAALPPVRLPDPLADGAVERRVQRLGCSYAAASRACASVACRARAAAAAAAARERERERERASLLDRLRLSRPDVRDEHE